MRRCSICHQEGHDARNCPNESRDQTFKGFVDGISKREAKTLQKEFLDLKDRCCPEGRLTAVTGSTSEMNKSIKGEPEHKKLT